MTTTTTIAELPTAPHAATAEAVGLALDVRPELGLSHQQSIERLARWGPNALPVAPPRSPWRVLLAQFKGVMTVILLGAAVLAASVGSIKDASVIMAVVVINALVGFYQEYRAERSLDALKSMLPVNATVRRDGSSQKIRAETVVPGDILLLEAGDSVAADGRLIVAAGLEIDESTLTGESRPAAKQCAQPVAADAPLGDRSNMAYMNTLLTRGRAELLVTATGSDTETGRLSRELAAIVESPTPLQAQLDQLAKRLGVIALTLVALLSLMQWWRGEGLTHIVLDAIALAVAAMPEGLPVVVTVTLALGMHKMAREHAIVKRLASVETLGCTTVICSDKTGTLTLNQMTATTFSYEGRLFEVTGEGYSAQGAITDSGAVAVAAEISALLQPLVACNDSRIEDGKVIGDPMEAALLVLAEKGGVVRDEVERALPRVAELPFDSAHKFMATFHRDGGQVRLFVKGAPDVLIARCSNWRVGGSEQSLDARHRQQIEADYQALGERGLRGLLIATRSLPAERFDPAGDLSPWVAELFFTGLIGLMDPPRAEARQAIAECQRAGIEVKMITGDHQTTATAIAGGLGLAGRTVSGTEIDRMDARQLAEAVDGVAVFCAGVAWQQGGHRSGATGQRPCRGDDRRRRQRRARLEASRHRCGHGRGRHRGGQGGCDDGAYRRQLRHHRYRRAPRAHAVRQHSQVRAVPAVDDDRRDPDGVRSGAIGDARAVYAAADFVGRDHHGRAARRVACTRRPTPANHGRAAACAR